MTGPHTPERQKENEELRYRDFEELEESEVNDEDILRYKRFGVDG